jgi:hypothetical protein
MVGKLVGNILMTKEESFTLESDMDMFLAEQLLKK